MLRWNAVLSLFLIAAGVLRAGEPLFVPHGAAEAGMAFAVTASPAHWSCFNNQALMTSVSGVSVSAAMETRFMMPALSSLAVSAVIATGPVPLGIIATHYGNGDYHRIFTGLASAVTITGRFSAGIQADYISERGVGDYKDVSHLTFETGLFCSLSPSLTMGFHLFNPLASLNSLPSSISTGIQWKSTDDLLLTLTGSKMTGEPLSIQCGVGWMVTESLTLRSGYSSSPSVFAFGLGWGMGSLRTDLGFLVNNVTGITSAVSFTWMVGK